MRAVISSKEQCRTDRSEAGVIVKMEHVSRGRAFLAVTSLSPHPFHPSPQEEAGLTLQETGSSGSLPGGHPL